VIDVDPERLHVTIPHFHDPARRGERMVELVLADPHGRRADSQGVGHAAHELTVHQELIQVAASWREPAVPTRVAHLDATPANVLVDEASGAAGSGPGAPCPAPRARGGPGHGRGSERLRCSRSEATPCRSLSSFPPRPTR
jgi:hypothetical protein